MIIDRKQLAQLADWEAAAVAIALPWSTSAASILLVVWLITLIPTLDAAAIWRELKSPAGCLPVLLWLIGAAGMLWADVSWAERLGGLGSFHRLLTIPLFLAQFRRSANARWALYGFLGSAIALLIASWALVFGLMSWQTNHAFGVVVHDVIAQSTIFLICAFAMIWLVRDFIVDGNWRLAICCAGLAVLFLANIMFIATSRADIVVLPLLIILLGWRWRGWQGAIVACVAAAVLAAGAWLASPYLRERVQRAIDDVEIYRTTHVHNDVGDHVEFLKKSMAFVREAPVFGHGTGSIPELFRRSAVAQSGAAAIVSVNPHNQVLAVAIQLGAMGAAVLLAMWLAHLLLFNTAGLLAWIGTVVVVESIVSSLTSSHLFDFVHGWLYVLAVGIMGGMMAGPFSGSGKATIENGGTLEFGGAATAIVALVFANGYWVVTDGATAVTFTNTGTGTETLKFDALASSSASLIYRGMISGFTASNDVIDFTGLTFVGTSNPLHLTLSSGHTIVTITEGADQVSFKLAGNHLGDTFIVSQDGGTGTQIIDPPALTASAAAPTSVLAAVEQGPTVAVRGDHFVFANGAAVNATTHDGLDANEQVDDFGHGMGQQFAQELHATIASLPAFDPLHHSDGSLSQSWETQFHQIVQATQSILH